MPLHIASFSRRNTTGSLGSLAIAPSSLASSRVSARTSSLSSSSLAPSGTDVDASAVPGVVSGGHGTTTIRR